MNKKKYLLPGALLLAALSASAGYMIRDAQDDEAKTARGPANEPPRRAPRLTLHKRALAIDPEDQKSGLEFRKYSLDVQLIRLSRMTPEQLKQEMGRLKKKISLNCDFPVQYLTYSYLSYKWGQLAPLEALEEIKSMERFNAQLCLPIIMKGWAEQHPEEAATYFARHRDELPRAIYILNIIAEEMTRHSPDNALQWIAGLSPAERTEALPSVLHTLKKDNPEEYKKQIEHFARQLSREELKHSELCDYLSARWAETDWEAASQWINTLPEEQKGRARNAALGELCTSDPDKAAAEFKKLEWQAQAEAAKIIARKLTSANPVDALKWLSENTPEKTILENMGTVITMESSRTPGLKESISQMKEGLVKDEALDKLVESLSWNYDYFIDFEDAVSLAQDIKNPEKRENRLYSTLGLWISKNPEKAGAWIKSSSLPEEAKKEALDRCAKSAGAEKPSVS